MIHDFNRLTLTPEDLELIESALHTQKKILSVQNEAGGTGAGRKLEDLSRLIKRISRARPPREQQAPASSMQRLLGFFRRYRQMHLKPQQNSGGKTLAVRETCLKPGYPS